MIQRIRNRLYFAVNGQWNTYHEWKISVTVRKEREKSINTCQMTIRLHAGHWLKLTFNENLPCASEVCQIKHKKNRVEKNYFNLFNVSDSFHKHPLLTQFTQCCILCHHPQSNLLHFNIIAS